MSGTDRLDELERLQRLKESGALDDEEFDREKQRILAEEPAATGSNLRRNLAIGAILVVAAVGLGVWMAQPMQQIAEKAKPVEAGSSASVVLPSESAPPPVELTPEARLAAAFYAATGRSGAYSAKVGGETAKIAPLKVLDLPFGPVLITSKTLADQCHGCAGSLGVYYLKQDGASFTVTGRWPEAVKGWGYGAPPGDWSLTTRFTSFPAIFAEGGFMGQGLECGSARLTELMPNGPVGSDLIYLSFSDAGNVDDSTGLTFQGAPARIDEGRIGNVVKDRSFEVQVAGEDGFSERYVKRDGKFVRETEESQLAC